MIKKIAVVLGILLSLIPMSNVFAAEENPNFLLGRLTDDGHSEMTDGNTTTYLGMNMKISYSWSYDTDVTVTNYSIVTANANGYIRYYGADGTLLNQTNIGVSNVTSGTYDIPITGVRKITVIGNHSSVQMQIKELRIHGNAPRTILYEEIKSLNAELKEKNKVILNWTNPSDNLDFIGTEIYRDGKLLTSLDKAESTFQDNDLDYETEYNYRVKAVYSDQKTTSGLSATIKTSKEPEPLVLREIKAEAEYNKVDLSWKLPANEALKHVNIYRDKVEQQSALSTFLIGEKVSAAAQTKIFETNGTYFNDLTVEPNSTYDYTLSITDTNGTETAYQDVQVKTPKEPTPVIVGGNISKEENGDYTYTWEEPTKGQVKVIVGGKEYKTVSASDKKITIPAADMKYTYLKDPDIQLVPISEYGTVGETTKPPSQLEVTELPFEPKDILGSGMQLLWLIAPFVLLGLSFLLVPKLRRLVFQSFKGKGSKEEKAARRTKDPNKDDEIAAPAPAPKETQERPIREPRAVIAKPTRQKPPRDIRISERQLKEPKMRKEKAPREPRISRFSREPREGRQRAAREERQPRTPREIRKGR